ncbi:integrin alpha-8-like [Oratosquilla oratoria]|uniref:integrin alpha-8-like n=1 Tax=Oratosquilla oratoria TaxID=337810 RepID=UPI003F7613AF
MFSPWGKKPGRSSRPAVRANLLPLLLFLLMILLVGPYHKSSWGVVAYNLVTSDKGVWEYQGPQKGSRFGYNVALWRDLAGKVSVVVSAPLARPQTAPAEVAEGGESSSASRLPVGTLYLCSVDGDCDVPGISPNIIDPNEVVALQEGLQVANLGIGFGETIFTNANSSSELVSCAPRYVKFLPKSRGYKIITPSLQSRGVCYIFSHGDTAPARLNTFMNPGVVSISKTAYSHGGTSVLLSEDSSSIYVAGPVAYYGQGSVWKVLLDAEQTEEGSTRTKSSDDSLDFSYEGWAMTWGNFRGRGRSRDLAVSHPGIDNFKGQVKFYTSDLLPIPERNLTGNQVSAFFGYVLAAGDFDGDGIDDLAVGSPLAGVFRKVPDGGSVFVYYHPLVQKQEDGAEEGAKEEEDARAEEEAQELKGLREFGRFGTSLLAQDLDLDGRYDLLVGAPYEQGGTVYVFHGLEHGLSIKPSQVIHATDFTLEHTGFGFSLGGGVDVDGNKHLDIVVGSWKSDTAVLIKSTSVVQLMGQVVTPPVLQLDDRSCQIMQPGHHEVDMICFTISLRMITNSSTYHGRIKISFLINLEAEQLVFRDNMSSRSLTKELWFDNKEHEINMSMVVKPYPELSVNDTLKLHVNASLIEHDKNSSDNRPLLDLPPVLSMSSQTFHAQVPWACNDSNVCFLKSDLSVKAAADTLIIGQKPFRVRVFIEAQEFTAFKVVLSFKFSHKLMFSHSTGNFFPTCIKRASEADTRLQECQITDTLVIGHKMIMDLHFEYDTVALMMEDNPALDFTFEIKSSNSRLDSTNNTFLLQVPVEIKQEVRVSGLSTEEVILVVTNKTVGPGLLFNTSQISDFTQEQIGPFFKHVYSIINEGPSPILTAELTVGIPFWINDERQILYLVDQLETTGPIKCAAPPIHPLHFKIKGYNSDEDNAHIHDSGRANTTNEFLALRETSTERMKTQPLLYRELMAPDAKNNNKTKRELKQRRGLDGGKINPRPLEITCKIQGLDIGMENKVAIPAVLVVASILEFPAKIHKLAITSRMILKVTSPNVSSCPKCDIKETNVSTSFIFIYPTGPSLVFPFWWLPSHAIMMAVMVLLMILLILYKLNFFKRKRPPQKPKTEDPQPDAELKEWEHYSIDEEYM